VQGRGNEARVFLKSRGDRGREKGCLGNPEKKEKERDISRENWSQHQSTYRYKSRDRVGTPQRNAIGKSAGGKLKPGDEKKGKT